MTPDFTLAQGDRLPSITATLIDASGVAVNLTGLSVTFKMRLSDESRPAITGGATITDAINGKVRYDWASGDTDTPGLYLVTWAVTFAGPKIESFPNSRAKRVSLEILPRLA